MLTQATVSSTPSRKDIEAALLCFLASPQLEDEENVSVALQATSQQAQSRAALLIAWQLWSIGHLDICCRLENVLHLAIPLCLQVDL